MIPRNEVREVTMHGEGDSGKREEKEKKRKSKGEGWKDQNVWII